MKKLLIILLLFVPFSLFATNPDPKYVHINGYYEETASSVVFKVWKSNSNNESDRVYHAGDISLIGDPRTGEVTIFSWELSGNNNFNVQLTFTITPLQAYSHGTYYIPQHTLKMYSGNDTKTHEFSSVQSGSSPYPGYRQGDTVTTGVFTVLSAVFTYNESIIANTPKTGYCTLQVLEYDEDTAGIFDYVSYVTVEFSAT